MEEGAVNGRMIETDAQELVDLAKAKVDLEMQIEDWVRALNSQNIDVTIGASGEDVANATSKRIQQAIDGTKKLLGEASE